MEESEGTKQRAGSIPPSAHEPSRRTLINPQKLLPVRSCATWFASSAAAHATAQRQAAKQDETFPFETRERAIHALPPPPSTY